jgi:beta-mannanase
MLQVNLQDIQNITESQMVALMSGQAVQVEQISITFQRWSKNKPSQNYYRAEGHLLAAYDELMEAIQAFMSNPAKEVGDESKEHAETAPDEEDQGRETSGGPVPHE